MPLNSPVLLVAGCQDNQESGDGIGHGRFTQELLRVWDEGRFQGDWKTLAERIVSNMPPEQTPRLTLIGREPGTAQRLVVRLADLLRGTLQVGMAQELPLAQELDVTGRYLEIEQVRFADRLTV